MVIDMQNDFITGTLGTEAARRIVPDVVEKIRGFDGDIYYTMDTHDENYSITQEGRNLPIAHCLRNSEGWLLQPDVAAAIAEKSTQEPFHKVDNFGSVELADELNSAGYDEIHFCGLCTDICVMTNVMLAKAFCPESVIYVDSKCCAGLTPQLHEAALDVMRSCQIKIG